MFFLPLFPFRCAVVSLLSSYTFPFAQHIFELFNLINLSILSQNFPQLAHSLQVYIDTFKSNQFSLGFDPKLDHLNYNSSVRHGIIDDSIILNYDFTIYVHDPFLYILFLMRGRWLIDNKYLLRES